MIEEPGNSNQNLVLVLVPYQSISPQIVLKYSHTLFVLWKTFWKEMPLYKITSKLRYKYLVFKATFQSCKKPSNQLHSINSEQTISATYGIFYYQNKEFYISNFESLLNPSGMAFPPSIQNFAATITAKPACSCNDLKILKKIAENHLTSYAITSKCLHSFAVLCSRVLIFKRVFQKLRVLPHLWQPKIFVH